MEADPGTLQKIALKKMWEPGPRKRRSLPHSQKIKERRDEEKYKSDNGSHGKKKGIGCVGGKLCSPGAKRNSQNTPHQKNKRGQRAARWNSTTKVNAAIKSRRLKGPGIG